MGHAYFSGFTDDFGNVLRLLNFRGDQFLELTSISEGIGEDRGATN